MHMSDALLNPAVGGAMWAATGGTIAYSAAKMRREVDGARVPLMGVLAAFVFAGQMINFTIPGTGSSGHLGGGMILAALLGPSAALIAMASILTIQALFFADGGLLALGCNIFNLGFLPAFVAYPVFFRPLAGRNPSPRRLGLASLAGAVAGLQLGALSMVLETVASGVAELPPLSFAALVLPIHLAIGVVEGLITAAVISFVWKVRPEALSREMTSEVRTWKVLAVLAAAAVILAGGISRFASTRPDGLEWSLEKSVGTAEPAAPETGTHKVLHGIQEKTALLPDYGSKGTEVGVGTSLSGLVGGLLTLLLAAGAAVVIKRRGGRGAGGERRKG